MNTFRLGNRTGTEATALAAIVISMALALQLSATSYEIGEIPDQRIWYGENARLEFRVSANALGEGAVIHMEATGTDSITGLITMDEARKTFYYESAPSDSGTFTVHFSAMLGDKGVRQDVRIMPLPRLPAETVVFGNDPIGDLPDPEDSAYIEITTNIIDNGSETFWFNALDRESLRSITIAGATVVFEDGHPNGLWSLHASEDIKDLTIHADILIIRDALHLPQTDITIYAREVRFEDREGGDVASISTEPMNMLEAAEAAVLEIVDHEVKSRIAAGEAQPGAKAGSLSLIAQTLSNPDERVRFFLNGGNGQNAGRGAPGEDGVSRETYNEARDGAGIPRFTWTDDRTIYWHWDGVFANNSGGKKYGPDMDAISPEMGGLPGEAGDGGDYGSNLDLAISVESKGGIEGAKAAYMRQTFNGEPGIVYERYFNDTGFGIEQSTKTFYPKLGRDGPSRPSAKPVGDPGSVSMIDKDDLRWLSPLVVEQVLIHLAHAYQKNHFDFVEEQAGLYTQLIELAAESPNWLDLDPAWAEHLLQLLDEFRSIRYRIGSNLDFFGNPAGWVPMLSFEVNKIAFENEIGRALRIMYLNYWLGNKASTLADRIDGMTTLRGEIRDQIEADRYEFGNLVDSIPGLEYEAAQVEQKINQTKADIEALKNELLKKAKRTVLLKKSAVVLGGIAQVFPVGQPLVGIAGTVVSGFASADPEQSTGETLLKSGINAAGFFSKSQAAKKANDAKLKAGEINLKDIETQQNQAIKDKLREMQGPIMDVLDESYNQMANSQSPSSEVEAELQRILADTPEYKEMVEQIEDLNKEKMALAARIAETMQQVSRLSLAITRNLITIDTLNREITADSLAYDPRTASLLEVMNERARERLLKYHYFMARAFEYRMLQTYEGDLDLNAVFDKFADLAEHDPEGDEKLDPDQFNSLRAVYENQISAITFKILDQYNSNRPSLSAPVRILMRPELLDTLNGGQTATLNLHDLGLFLPDQENLRIVDLEVIELEVDYVGNKDDIVYADIEFQHSGESILNQNGESYLFRHYNDATRQKIEWSTRFDPYYGDLDPVQPAAADQSMLQALLTTDSNAPSTEDLLLYSRPAARADLAVKRQINAQPGADMKITKMRIELVYDFTRKDEKIKTLRFAETADGIRPPVIISPSDLNDRTHGEGAFERSYDIGTRVSVEVPEVYGHYRFVGWEGSGFSDPDRATTSIALSDNIQVRPVYTYAEDCSVAVDGGMGTGMYLEGDTVAIEAIVPEGHRFIQWQGAVVDDSTSPTTFMVVGSDMQVSAITAAIQAVWLENISTRAQVGSGADILIPGFVIEGVVPKTLLIRAVGPTLGNYAVKGFLEDPTLSLFRDKEKIATNDDWGLSDNHGEMASAAALVGAFPLAADSKDAAILTRLDPGAYTVKVSGSNQTTGVSLVEVYDVEPDADGSRLVNISGRAQVGTGGDILIPGFVVDGSSGKKYLIRAIGPSLGILGVTGVLEDPKLTVFKDGTEIVTNDNWGDVANFDELRAASIRVGAFELDPDSADAAVYLPLESGRHTIKVSGVDGTTGVALVEIYEVEQP